MTDVILVTVDTLRADALGFAGNTEVETPAFDRLAAAGSVFPQSRAHNVVTLPSHANILTGLHPYEHGIRDNAGFKLAESVPTLATRLQAAGFATGAFVAAFPLDRRFGLGRGFDVYDDRLPAAAAGTRVAERSGAKVVEAAVNWWRANGGRKRFLWVHFYEPHAPYAPPEPWASRHPTRPYLGEVEAVDAYLGRLLDAIVEQDSETALIAVTSDHGEALGDHGEQTHGLFAYEATLRVPLIIWGSGVPVGTDERPARHIDLAPTILERVGLEVSGLPGRSLLAEPEVEPITYFESLTATLSHGWAPLRGVVADGFKAIELPEPELYSLADDAVEAENRVATETALLRRLLRMLPRESEWPPTAGPVSDAELRDFRSLGYLAGAAPRKTSFDVDDDPKRLLPVHEKVHQIVGALEAGDAATAVRLARDAIRMRADLGIAHYYLAQALLDTGRQGEALAAMSAAHDAGYATPVLERQLALTLSAAGQPARAIEVLRAAVAVEDPEALNVLGAVLTEAGDQKAARQALERADALDPDNPTTLETLALVALRTGAWTEAKGAAQRALDRDPGLSLAWSYLGGALHGLGERRRAIECWDRSLDIDPMNFDVLYNLAITALEVGDGQRARQALERFVSSAPPDRYGPDIELARQRLQALPRDSR